MQCLDVQDDAEEAEWFDMRKLPSKLAFDHKIIVRTAFEHLLKEHASTGDPRNRSTIIATLLQLQWPEAE